VDYSAFVVWLMSAVVHVCVNSVSTHRRHVMSDLWIYILCFVAGYLIGVLTIVLLVMSRDSEHGMDRSPSAAGAREGYRDKCRTGLLERAH
jgi:hypothetical protein